MFSYSPSQRAFFHPDFHGVAMPADGVEITPEEHQSLMAGQSRGMEIVPGEDGRPICRQPDGPSREAQMVRLRADRSARLAACDWTQLPDVALSDAQREAWRGYRQSLRDLPARIANPAKVRWPKPPEA